MELIFADLRAAWTQTGKAASHVFHLVLHGQTTVAVNCHEPSVDQSVKLLYDQGFLVCKQSILVVTKSNIFRRLLNDFSTKLNQMLKLLNLID